MSVPWATWVCKREGLQDWTCKTASGGNVCIRDSKTIFVHSQHEFVPGMWLHEIAHALVVDDNLHGYKWADKFTELVSRYCTYPD